MNMNTVARAAVGVYLGVAAVCCLAAATPGFAQERVPNTILRGTVVDHLTGTPINLAAVHLLTVDGRTLRTVYSDSLGRFALPVEEARQLRISSERMGYRAMQSRPIVLGDPPWEPLQLRLPPVALPLPTLTVTTESRLAPLRRTEQLISGRVFEDNTTTPVPGATVYLLHSNGRTISRAISDEHGLFRLVTPIPGVYRLRGERVGYRTSESSDIGTGLGDTITVDFYLGVSALPLAPLVVRASAKPWGPRSGDAGLEDFYNRMARWHVFSEFITSQELAAADSIGTPLWRLIDHKVLRKPHGCTGGTKVFLNGGEIVVDSAALEDRYPPHVLAGVEVHSAPTIPAEFPMRGARPGSMICTVIALWLKR
jgi:hypothetical protein